MVHIAVQRSEQDDGALPLAAQIAAQRHTVFTRQHDIQQHQIGLFARDNLFRPVAARFYHHVHIVFAKVGGNQCADLGIVLNENNFIHIVYACTHLSSFESLCRNRG